MQRPASPELRDCWECRCRAGRLDGRLFPPTAAAEASVSPKAADEAAGTDISPCHSWPDTRLREVLWLGVCPAESHVDASLTKSAAAVKAWEKSRI